ncbi:MAG: hemerythrin domain-containing protein [Candidatus Binataceae bacterium]
METKQIPEAASKESQMKFTLAKLTGEDIKLRLQILEAASVAARLALDPGSHELREKAAKAWAKIDAAMVKHLGNEDQTVLPWANSVVDFPRHLVDRARKKHEQILALHDIIATHSFEKGSNKAVAAEARNLCVYATTLDDLIAGEERELFPVMRRVLFHRPQP